MKFINDSEQIPYETILNINGFYLWQQLSILLAGLLHKTNNKLSHLQGAKNQQETINMIDQSIQSINDPFHYVAIRINLFQDLFYIRYQGTVLTWSAKLKSSVLLYMRKGMV
jgi:hypothetical protein